LLELDYRVRSPVSETVLRTFVAALEGSDIEVTGANIDGLSLLFKEFGFRAQLSVRRNGVCNDFREFSDERFAALDEKIMLKDDQIASLNEQVVRQERRIAALEAGLNRLTHGGS
jgi:hypothetical protein